MVEDERMPKWAAVYEKGGEVFRVEFFAPTREWAEGYCEKMAREHWKAPYRMEEAR